MNTTVERIKVEILLDAPLARMAMEIVEKAGATGHTMFSAAGGTGEGGRWREDLLTSADAKVLLLTITSAEIADMIVEALRPLLDSHGIIIMTSAVKVVRGEKF